MITSEIVRVVAFYAVSCLLVGSAAVAVFSRTMRESLVALLVSICGIAILFVMLGAVYIGLVYLVILSSTASATMILYSVWGERALTPTSKKRQVSVSAIISGIVVCVVLLAIVVQGTFTGRAPTAVRPTVHSAGLLVLMKFYFPLILLIFSMPATIAGALYFVSDRKR